MKISRVRGSLYNVHNAITGWKMASGGRDTHELVFVRIDTDEGFFGIGISTGSTYISGDTSGQQLELVNRLLGEMINDRNSLFGVSRRELEIALSDPPAAPVSEPQAQQGE